MEEKRRCVWSVLLESYCLPQFVRFVSMCCLGSSFANVDISHSVQFVLLVFHARCERKSICHLCSRIPEAHHLHLAQLELFSSLSLVRSRRLCPCTHSCLSLQNSLNDSSDLFSTFVVVWFDRSPMRCQRTTPTTSCFAVSLDVSRHRAESFLAQPPESLTTCLNLITPLAQVAPFRCMIRESNSTALSRQSVCSLYHPRASLGSKFCSPIPFLASVSSQNSLLFVALALPLLCSLLLLWSLLS